MNQLWDELKVPQSIREMIADKPYELDDVGRSGSTVVTFEDMVLKIEPHTEKLDESIETMRWMGRRVPVPQVIRYEVADGKSYLLMSKIEGKMSCDPYYMDRPDEVVELLAEGLRMLWNADTEGCRQLWSMEEDLKKVRETLEAHWKEGERIQGPDGMLFESPEQVMEWMEANQPEVELALSHGDYCMPNVFLKDGHVSGFIDLGASGVADKYWDIADCYWSLKYNFNGYFGGKVHEDFDPNLLFEKLGPEIDVKKVQYFLMVRDLADK